MVMSGQSSNREVNHGRLIPVISGLAILSITIGLFTLLENDDAKLKTHFVFGKQVTEDLSVHFEGIELQPGPQDEMLTVKGSWIFLAYGYTSCPDICPTTLLTLKVTIDELVSLYPDETINTVFYTLEPRVDTQVKLRQYVNYFSEDIVTARPHSQKVAKHFESLLGIKKQTTFEGQVSKINHNANIYLLDPDENLRFVFQPIVSSNKIELPSKAQLTQGFSAAYEFRKGR